MKRAATLLRTIVPKDQLDCIAELLDLASGDEMAEVRSAVAQAIVALHHSRFDEIAAKLQNDVDPYVRSAAEASVRRRGQDGAEDGTGAVTLSAELLQLAALCPPDVLRAVHEVDRAEFAKLAKQVKHDSNTIAMALDACHAALREELGRARPSATRCLELVATAERRREQLGRVTQRLQEYVQPLPRHYRQETIRDVVEDAANVVREGHKNRKRVTVDVRVGRDLTVVIARDRVHEAIINVVANAFDAISGKGTVTIDADLHEGGDEVLLRVIDTGCGIRPQTLAKIFEFGTTTKQSDEATAGEHMGWGLKLARRFIVLDNSGTIDVKSEWGKGATVLITLPTRRPDVGVVRDEDEA